MFTDNTVTPANLYRVMLVFIWELQHHNLNPQALNLIARVFDVQPSLGGASLAGRRR